MSTKRIKLYSARDVKRAQEEHKQVHDYFTRKTKGRKTVQVRISEDWHKKIKKIAKKEEVMLSFFLDDICRFFFKHYSK